VHELSVTQSVLEIAQRHTPTGCCVTDIYLVVGQLASIVDDSVQFYWDLISQGTPAFGATLHFRRIPAALHCRACGLHYGLDGQALACPRCGGLQVRITAGEEFYVESIEVSEDESIHR
jgi:hydrogenase nickel incorporation protein HypA/HybF